MMLSVSMQSSTGAPLTNSVANQPAPAIATNSAAATTELNNSQEQNAGTEQQAELFAGQLGDVLVSAELVGSEMIGSEMIDAESVSTEILSEQVASLSLEQSGVEQQGQPQNQEQPNAEAWLQAMLDQQQLQLAARDSAAVTGNPAVAANTVVPLGINSVAATPATQRVSATGLEKTANTHSDLTNALVTGPGIGANQEKNHPVGNTKTPLANKAFDSLVNTSVNSNTTANSNANSNITAIVAQTGAASETRVTETGSNSVLANTSVAINSSATNMVQLASSVINETGAGESISSTIAPTALPVSGTENASRTVQTQLSLHAPEAKWGEQLLHALRDNVQVQIQQKIQNATIRLDPPELGSLEIYISHESGRLHVQITASQADVARLIQHTSDRLRQELSGPQFTQVNIQTSAEGQSGQQQSRERQRFVGDELILANEQAFVGSDQQTKRPADVLVTV